MRLFTILGDEGPLDPKWRFRFSEGYSHLEGRYCFYICVSGPISDLGPAYGIFSYSGLVTDAPKILWEGTGWHTWESDGSFHFSTSKVPPVSTYGTVHDWQILSFARGYFYQADILGFPLRVSEGTAAFDVSFLSSTKRIPLGPLHDVLPQALSWALSVVERFASDIRGLNLDPPPATEVRNRFDIIEEL